MEDLCKIRDVYRAIAEFETQFMQHASTLSSAFCLSVVSALFKLLCLNRKNHRVITEC